VGVPRVCVWGLLAGGRKAEGGSSGKGPPRPPSGCGKRKGKEGGLALLPVGRSAEAAGEGKNKRAGGFRRGSRGEGPFLHHLRDAAHCLDGGGPCVAARALAGRQQLVAVADVGTCADGALGRGAPRRRRNGGSRGGAAPEYRGDRGSPTHHDHDLPLALGLQDGLQDLPEGASSEQACSGRGGDHQFWCCAFVSGSFNVLPSGKPLLADRLSRYLIASAVFRKIRAVPTVFSTGKHNNHFISRVRRVVRRTVQGARGANPGNLGTEGKDRKICLLEVRSRSSDLCEYLHA